MPKRMTPGTQRKSKKAATKAKLKSDVRHLRPADDSGGIAVPVRVITSTGQNDNEAEATGSDSPEEQMPEATPGKRRRGLPRPVLRVLVAAIVLLIIFVVAGVGYTYYEGNSSPAAAVVMPATTQAVREIKPATPLANAPESAAVEMISSPVSPGSEASLTVKTLAGSVCSISVTYDKKPTAAAGLGPQTADTFGGASWTWVVDKTAPAGTWPVKVTCVRGAHSAVVQADLVVIEA